MEYRCVTTSVEGFVQQLAVAYITHGYWFYVAGKIPDGKDPAAVDAKLIAMYGVAITKWARCRRKKQGLANMQYLRHERFFVLLATKGRHEFFERERTSIRDVRRVQIQFAGYSIGCKKGLDGRWHASVRISQYDHICIKARLVDFGLQCAPSALETKFAQLHYEPYAPIRRQLNETRRAVNRARRTAGLAPLAMPDSAVARRIVRPFGLPSVATVPASPPGNHSALIFDRT